MSLTRDEHLVMNLLGEVAGRMAKIIGEGPTRQQDLAEMVTHVHDLQRMVMSQSAGRDHPGLYRLLGTVVANADPVKPKFVALSYREREVADLLCLGKSIPEVAKELDLSESTVKTYVTHIYEKYGVDNRVRLMLAHR